MRFNNINYASNGLLDKIKQLGDNIVGCEVGVWKAENLCQILESCSNISKMYAIDQYKPYQDWCGYIDESWINGIKQKAQENLKSIEQSTKVLFLELSSVDAVENISDGGLDFIFIDGDHSYEKAYEDFCNYYPKVKSGGLFSGHDYSLDGVNKALRQFLSENGYEFDSLNLVTNDSWYLIKK